MNYFILKNDDGEVCAMIFAIAWLPVFYLNGIKTNEQHYADSTWICDGFHFY